MTTRRSLFGWFGSSGREVAGVARHRNSRSGSVKSRNVDRSREFDKRERVGALPSFSSFSAARTVTCITIRPRHCRASRTDRRDRRCAYEVGIRLAIFVKRSVVGFLPSVSMTALSTFSTIVRMSFRKRSAISTAIFLAGVQAWMRHDNRQRRSREFGRPDNGGGRSAGMADTGTPPGWELKKFCEMFCHWRLHATRFRPFVTGGGV